MKYCDFDLSKFENTRGGFIKEEEGENPRERTEYVPIESEDALRCFECKSVDVDIVIYKAFDVLVCFSCKKRFPEKYSLLTKTEARLDYLITEPELKDADLFRVLRKRNPHRGGHDMYLYLRMQAEAYAIQKWGSLELLDKEHELRENTKKERAGQQFKRKLTVLRKSTVNKSKSVHSHEFIDGKCSCGLKVNAEEI